MAITPYIDLGKLFTANQRTVNLNNNGYGVYEIVPSEFSDIAGSQLDLDTFTTNLSGNPTPNLCTGLIAWISDTPGGLPVAHGELADSYLRVADGKLDLNWGMSTNPGSVDTRDGSGNIIYNVDYIIDYNAGPYYLNIAYCEADCLDNVVNCNTTDPVKNIYAGDCDSTSTIWAGAKTMGSKHCGSYPGAYDLSATTPVTGATTAWNDNQDIYYPLGSASTTQDLEAGSTYIFKLDYNLINSGIFEGSVSVRTVSDTENVTMWISETSLGNGISATNGCEAKKIVGHAGAQLTIKAKGNTTNRDIDLDVISGKDLYIQFQTLSDVTITDFKIVFKEVTEMDPSISYIAPLGSQTTVTPVGICSGVNTVFNFPESGKYIVSAHYTDDTGATYQQTKTVDIDISGTPNNGLLKVPARDPNYDAGGVITKGFLGYGPQYQCSPGKFGNNPQYVNIGSSFTYNAQSYNMTHNMAGCLAFNCLDNCLGTNITGKGPNGLISRGTIDTCVAEFYGTTLPSGTAITWTGGPIDQQFADVKEDILTYALVIPTKELSDTSTVHGTMEATGNNVLMWISTEPGGGPNNCYGFLDSYANYYSMNGQMKFYATYSNGIVEKFSKSHAQLEMGHTYFVNIARVSGSIQKYLEGGALTFTNNKNIGLKFGGMSSWNYSDSATSFTPAQGISDSAIVSGTKFGTISPAQAVEPMSFSVDENYGICAETWDLTTTDKVQVSVAPQSRVAMPFTTTTKMYKGEFLFTTGNKSFVGNDVRAYIVDAPEKTSQNAYGKIVYASANSTGGTDLAFNIEIEVDNYTATLSGDAVLDKFTTYYMVVENNSNNMYTGDRLLTMVQDPAYGLPNTNYSLYPPWCINSNKVNVGGATDTTSVRGTQRITPTKLGADINCQFTDNQTVNFYTLGQRFTIKGQDIICNSLISACLGEKRNPTIQDVLRCAGVNHDSLNSDTPFPNPSYSGSLPTDRDNVRNTTSPDPEVLTFTSGNGMNVFSSDATPATVLTGGAYTVDQSVRTAIEGGDFSEFNLNGLKNNAFTGNAKNVNWQDYLSQFEKFGNYTGFSNLPLTGNNDLIPSSFKLNKRKVKNPNVYGIEIPLKDGRFVNATNQRITGGTIKKLAKPLKVQPRIPRALKTYNIRDEAYSKAVPTNINQTYRNTYYNPRSIGSYFSTKGRQIQNIGNTGFIADPQTLNVPGGGFLSSSGANESIPGNAPRLSRKISDTAGGEDYLLPEQLQPIATDIVYAKVPEMSMQPLKIDEFGNYVPAGPEAKIDLRQATPEAKISALQTASVADGSELYINDRKIVFKYGGSLESIKSQINCGKLGVTAVQGTDADTGQQILTISSCDSSPWTVANGCGGGIFQQVGDFHINRGFDQSKTVTSVFVSQEQLLGQPTITTENEINSSNVITKSTSTPSFPNADGTEVINIPYTDQNFPNTGRLVDVNFDRNLYIDTAFPATAATAQDKFEAKNFGDFAVPDNKGLFLPQESVSVSTAGKGYSVGDRLRLVGGTPVNTNKGPLTVICIESSGAGYVDPAKLKVQIGDGSTPGFGAVAEVYSLDMNGGIKEISLLNYGVGYDPARPPKITIIDNHSEDAYRSQQIINGLNQFESVPLVANDVFRFDYPEIIEPTSTDDTVMEAYVQVTQTYYRVSGTESGVFQLGGTTDTNSCSMYYGGNTVDGNYPTININSGNIFGNVTHVPYKAVIGLPAENAVTRGQYIKISSSGVGANASIVNSIPDLLCSDHMIGKDGSGNDVIAYNMPIVRHRALLNASTIEAVAQEMSTGNVTVSVAKRFLPSNSVGTFIPVAPYGIPKVDAELSALIGIDPGKTNEDGIDAADPFVAGYAALGGPLRVAKFLVTSIDEDGGIAGLKLLDRGLYRVFPSDLTFGIPLEYDAELLGTPTASAQAFDRAQNTRVTSADSLGGVDPLNNNILYGFSHPEYWDPNAGEARSPFGKTTLDVGDNAQAAGGKHPQWIRANEYKQIDINGSISYVSYWGTPGAYDPTTLVQITETDSQGNQISSYVPKTLQLELDVSGRPTSVRTPRTIPGGQGARVFLTAQDVPDCSEEGTAQQDLGLPDVVRELDGARTFVDAANNGLESVGYLPSDVSWEVDGEGDTETSPIANVSLNSIYPGVRFNGLDWFGLPSDDYAVGALCIQATLSSPNLTVTQQQTELEKIYQSSDVFGVSQDSFSLPELDNDLPITNNSGELTASVLSLLCIDSIQTDPNSVFGNSSKDNNKLTIKELYKYDISNIFGQEVKLDGSKQEVDAYVFQSKRFQNLDQVDLFSYLDDINTKRNNYIDVPDKLWVDSVTLDDSLANIAVRFPDFQQGGWGFFEDNLMTRYQTPLVDTRYVHNSIIYDPQSGARTVDLYPWDPFKGVMPGFMDKEIDYISEADPVVYNAQRHQFGVKQIGAVWWDTSTIRYQWYEQGTNVERWRNWGKAFPGSTVIICEWVESRAKPQNYTGDGTPRWTDKYITERRWDPVSQEYIFFYYYWVMNRTTVDARLRETRNRKYDTRTIARYLSDPVGFGIHMVSFLSSNALMFSNLSDVLRDSGNHVQINLARDLDPDGIKHTAWKLIREDDENSTIPENITLKLTDSLSGVNQVGDVVPDPGLSSVMSYGAEFRPRQSMFVNTKEARRTMAYVLNEIFANLKLYTDFPTWDNNFPSTDTWQYIERVNYYATIYVDEKTNEAVRYDDSYKPIFNVATISDLNALTNLPDGTVVQVAGTELAEPQLWIYQQETSNFSQIAILNDTIRFKDTVFTDDTNSQMSLEIRNVLNLFNDDLFQRFNFWNILFFEMLKYAYMEQRQLDWAFKTTYLYVEKEEEDLIQISGFKPDNYQAILDYMDEAKPYSSKVREYRDGKSPPIEMIGVIQPDDGIPGDGDYDDINSGVPGIPGLPGPGEGPGNGPPSDVNPNAGLRSVSDFDKPPYPDPETSTIRILDDYNQTDREILATNGDYVNYFSIDNKGNDPIRHIKTNLTYDRTNWRFTEYKWNANTTPLENSISNNIVNLTTQSVQEVGANANVRAIDRIFKFDPEVINQFNLDIENNYGVYDNNIAYPANSYVRRANDILSASFDLYKSNKDIPSYSGFKSSDWDIQEAPYTDINTNVEVVTSIVESGNLNFTLALLKNKVGGDWQGETLDANVFTKVVPGADPTYDYQTQFGYGTEDYEQFYWDVVQEVNNYVGIFKPPPEVNLRRNDRDYDGFDGISFLRVLYGEERPEELIQVDPYETFIVNCVTNTETAVIPIGAADVWINPRTGETVRGLNGNLDISDGKLISSNITLNNTIVTVGNVKAESTPDIGNTIVLPKTQLGIPPGSGAILDVTWDIELANANVIAENNNTNTNVWHTTANSIVVTSPGYNYKIGDVFYITPANNISSSGNVTVELQPGNTEVTVTNISDVGAILSVNLSDDLIDRSYGTCRAVSIEAMDTDGDGSGAEFRLNLQNPPDGWPGGATWPQIANVEVLSGGTDYDIDTTTVYLTVALQNNANPVQFQIFESLFGQTDYSRVRERTALKQDLFTWSEEIIVVDPALLPDPLPGRSGYMWIDGSELVKYDRKDNTTGIITQFQRGAEGTTIQNWEANTSVWDGSEANSFNDIDPWRNIWLDQGYRYEQLYNWDDDNYDDNDTPGNVFVINSEDDANVYTESNLDVIISEIYDSSTGTGWQPGWDYGNIITQTCNVTSISYIQQGLARFTLDCPVPQNRNFCRIQTDFSDGDLQFLLDENLAVITLELPLTNTDIIAEQVAGNGNVVTNVVLVPQGNDKYDPIATVRSNVFVTGTATGNISITENFTSVLEPNANITAFADITGQNVSQIANTINSFGLPSVAALVDNVWDQGTRRNYLRITGRYFTINEIDTPMLHIQPGDYAAEWFEYNKNTTNTILVPDELWTSERLVEGMSNTLITFNIDLNNIPWDEANAAGFPALSLADLANTDSTDNNSIMKFLHGIDPPPTAI